MKTFLLALMISTALLAQDSFRVQMTGQGPPMILIPGLASSGETWDSTAARYKHRYECHVLTLAGFAGVPPAAIPSSGLLPKVREDLTAYIRDKKLTKPVVMGHSLGGYIALDFASTYTDVVSKLVIVDTYPFTMGLDPQMTPEAAKKIAVQIRDGILGTSKEAYDASSRAGASTNGMATSEASKKRLIDWTLASDQRTVAQAISEMLGGDLRSDAARVTAPTLVLAAWRGSEQYGANYEVVDRNMHDQYSKLKGVEIHVSDTSRHFIMWDDPEWMFGHLDRFLGVK